MAEMASRRKETEAKLLLRWRASAKNYATIRSRYEYFYQKSVITDKNKEKYDKLLDALPEIKFFELETEEEARYYLKNTSTKELEKLTKTISDAVESYEYRTLLEKAKGMAYTAEHGKKRKKGFGYDPNFSTNIIAYNRKKANYISE